jgi:hypothetical protein
MDPKRDIIVSMRSWENPTPEHQFSFSSMLA